jgi:predicted ATPase/DNA-binding CsgD family transcriptional regulator
MNRLAGRGDQAAAPINLPHHLTSFVGREAELRSLKALLASSRLVTLIGTGGAGKTRLAAEITRSSLKLWPDGIWWIELAPVNDVAGAVVATLELPGRGSAGDVVTSWLAARRTLLVLDNCEHLIAACAAFCQDALTRCSGLTIIATSREPLGVSGEARWPVTSLRDADALHLFEARARLVSPDFKVATPNLDPVTQICQRLDRLPLAIEMAAARLDMMTERELLTNLNDNFRILTSGTRAVPERQQTMVAAIDWSHRLLTDDEARLFRRLSVFRGGFTLEAAEAVCLEGLDAGLIALLTALVRKSMVVADRLDDGSSRYRLLESHLDYSAERLREAGEHQLMRKRHYEYFLECLGIPTVSSVGPQKVEAPRGIVDQSWKARESANLWDALTWAHDNTEDMGLSLALDVADFEIGDHARARTVLLDLLAHSPAKGALRAKALSKAARLTSRQGDHDASCALADQGVALARELADPEMLAYVVNSAGTVYRQSGRLDIAARMYDEARALMEGSSNRHLAFAVKNSLGVLAVEQGDYAAALDILNDCVAHSRSESDEPGLARHLESLANAQLGLGDHEAASASWKEALSIFRDHNDPFGTIWSLGGLSLAAAARGDDERVLRLAAVADRMSREWSLSTGSFRLTQLEESCARARGRLGARRADGAWSDGETMGSARALEYALGEDRSAAKPDLEAGPLSRREREVAAMVADGMTNRQIAEKLFIAERTAEGHVERIRNKLGVRSRTEVATWAVEHGLGPRRLDKHPPASTV